MNELAYKKQLIVEYKKLEKGNQKMTLLFYPDMAEFMTDNEDNAEKDNDSENNDNYAKNEDYVNSDSTDDDNSL